MKLCLSYPALSALLAILCIACFTNACSKQESAGNGIRYNPEEQKAVIETTIHDEDLVRAAVEGIKLHEEYTATNFEAKQKAYIARMTPQMQEPARKYLPNRVRQITKAQASNIVKPDFASSQLHKVPAGDGVRVQVKIESDNQLRAKGETHEPRRMIYVVNMLVYDMETIQFQGIGIKEAE